MLGDYAAARPLVAECMRLYQELGDAWSLAHTLLLSAGLAVGSARAYPALRLAGAAAAQQEAIGVTLPAILSDPYERMLDPARAALGAPAQAEAWAEGRAEPGSGAHLRGAGAALSCGNRSCYANNGRQMRKRLMPEGAFWGTHASCRAPLCRGALRALPRRRGDPDRRSRSRTLKRSFQSFWRHVAPGSRYWRC
jgi:hypothetical protein